MHPFLITQDIEELKTTDTDDAKIPAMAHNGVFGEFTDYKSKFSDTFHFIELFMSSPNVIKLLKLDQDKFEKTFTDILSYNKLAFVLPDHDMILVGNFQEDEGYFHSNSGYKSYVRDYGGSSTRTKTNNKAFSMTGLFLSRTI